MQGTNPCLYRSREGCLQDGALHYIRKHASLRTLSVLFGQHSSTDLFAVCHARHIKDSRDSKEIQEIQRIKNIITCITLENMEQTQVDVKQRPGYKAVVLLIASGPALQQDSTACPLACIGICFEYTWYIPGIYLV
jgi:hypothetical protein